MFVIPLFLLIIQACLPTKQVVEHFDKRDKTTIVKQHKAKYPYHASDTRIFDLIHTDLKVVPVWENQTLNGIAKLTLKPYFYPTQKLILDAKGMSFSKVAIHTKEGVKTLKYDYDSLQLSIQLDKKYTKKDTIVVEIVYQSNPNKLTGNGSKAINDDKGLYFINPYGRDKVKPRQLWTQGETEASSCWFPTIDSPNEKCSQRISIQVDSSLTTLSNGVLISSEIKGGLRVDIWEQKKPHAPYLFMIAVGEFAVVKDSWRGMPVNYLVPAKDSAYAREVFGNTPEMLSFYSDILGYDYPWDKYNQIVVSDYVSGAMENTGAVIHGKWVYTTPAERIDYNNEDVVAHELFHHWFGDLVTCESWSNLPLNESFATYGEYLWIDYKYGKYKADKQLRGDYLAYLSDTPRVNLIRYHYKHREDMFDRHSYQKGGRILHMLRNIVGDDAFFASLKLYLHNRAFKNAEVHDLRMAFEEVTGQDLNWFFNQWFLDKGHPILNVNWEHLGDSLVLNVDQVQSANQPTFKFPVDVDIYFGDKVESKKLWITKRTESFVFQGLGGAEAVNFDSKKVLLIELNQSLTPEEAFVLFKESDDYGTKLESMIQVKGDTSITSWELMNLAAKDKFNSFRKLSVYFSTPFDEGKTEEHKAFLFDMFDKDPSSDVRVAIINSTQSTWPGDSSLITFYKKSLNDSSINVKLTALDVINEIAREDALLRAYELEKETDSRVIRQLASMYIGVRDESKIKWYNWAMKQVEARSKEYVIYKYSQYLFEKGNDIIWKACKALEEEAIHENNKKVRVEAALAIQRLRERNIQRIEDIRKDIKDKKEASRGKPYDLKILIEKHEELLAHDKRMAELLQKIYDAEINENNKKEYNNNGLITTVVPDFNQEEEAENSTDGKAAESKQRL